MKAKEKARKLLSGQTQFTRLARFAVAAACMAAAICANAAENFMWRGTTENAVWDTTSLNWASDGSTTARKAWVNSASNSNPRFDSQGAKDITVVPEGVEGFECDIYGGNHTLSGGPVTVHVIDTDGGNLTIFNQVTCTDTSYGFRMHGGNGTFTVGDGGYLDAYFSPYAGDYAGKVIVLTNGTFKATFNRNALNNSNKPTIYFNGGALLHTWNDWQNHVTFGNTKMVIGEGGMVVKSRATSGNTYLPRPIGTDTSLPTDGGIIVSNLTNYLLFENGANHTYRGGLHIKSTSWQIGIEGSDSSTSWALGAKPATPTDDIFFESPSNTTSSVLVGHGSGATLDANRNLRIGNGVTARIGTYNSGSSLTIKGTFSCENPQTGFLLVENSTGTTTLNPGAGRTNHIGRLWVAKPLTIASGTTLLEGNTGVVDQDNSLHVRNGGTLTISGGEVITTGSGYYATQNGTLVVSGGLLDLGDRDFLHAHKSPATTTVRNGGRLHVKDIRIADDGCGSDASKSVLNLETGGVVRVTRDIYIHNVHSTYKATVNCNGGTLEWANTASSHNCPVTAGGDHSLDNTLNGLTWNVKEGGFVVSNDCHCYFRPALISAAANDGGVTKWGSGTFALFSTGSTFNGPLTVMQGDFRLGASGVIPATCTMRVAAGANFIMNGANYCQTLARIEGSGSIHGTSSSAVLTVTSAIAPGMGADSLGTLTVMDHALNLADDVALEIDVDAAGNSDCLQYGVNYAEQIDLSKMTLQVNDLTKLNSDYRYTIAKLKGGIKDGALFKSTNLPPDSNWMLHYYSATHELKLVYEKGTKIIIR